MPSSRRVHQRSTAFVTLRTYEDNLRRAGCGSGYAASNDRATQFTYTRESAYVLEVYGERNAMTTTRGRVSGPLFFFAN